MSNPLPSIPPVPPALQINAPPSTWERLSSWISENKAVVYTIAGIAVVVTGAGAVYYLNGDAVSFHHYNPLSADCILGTHTRHHPLHLALTLLFLIDRLPSRLLPPRLARRSAASARKLSARPPIPLKPPPRLLSPRPPSPRLLPLKASPSSPKSMRTMSRPSLPSSAKSMPSSSSRPATRPTATRPTTRPLSSTPRLSSASPTPSSTPTVLRAEAP